MPQSNARFRSLTAQEEVYWLLNWNSPIHPVLAAHVTGPTVPEQWRAALDQLQQRHPILSMSIEAPDPRQTGNSRPFFKQQRGLPIPLRVVQRASVPRWEAEIEQQLAMPFAPGQAPLLRAVLIYEPDRSILILAGSHSIADGTSFVFLFRDIMTAMAGWPLEALPFARSAEDLLELRPAAPKQAVTEDLSSAPVNRAETATVVSLQLSKPLTQALVTVSREKNTTVHGMLAASLVLALRQQAPQFLHKPMRFISPVNTRTLLGVHDDCGMYFTSPQASFSPAETLSFWEIAQSMRQGIVEASTRDALVAATTAMQGMIASGLTKAEAAGMLHGAFGMDILLSNLGRTPYGSIFGRLHLESLWGPAVLGGLPELQVVGVATTNDSLCLLLTSYRPIPKLLEAVEATLAAVCTERGMQIEGTR